MGEEWTRRSSKDSSGSAKTYGGIAGYEPCPEDGVTGWATTYSLTMGLQHELGIGPVVANFGPGTLAGIQARPDTALGEENANIRNILQCGLFAKGYWGGSGDGTYSSTTDRAVTEMAYDMGTTSPGEPQFVTPEVFKALLSMDAYVVTAGGTEKVRHIRQSLMKALQYEVGIPEDLANGNFGPGTKAGLRRNPVSVGSTGILVQLFSAACVFDEPVGNVRTTFTHSFDADLEEFVKIFQRFSALDDTGRGDYRTWAQLLISTGDPDRSASGCDTRFTIAADRARALFDDGYRYVGRYLGEPPESTLNKELQPGELANIFDAGLSVFPIWQYNARELADFSYTSGFQVALRAHERAVHHGFNRGTVIYFAVDYDVTQADIESNIVPYFSGVPAGLINQGKRYVHGVYGARNVGAEVTKSTYARWSSVSGMSRGFSGNLGFPLPANWAFNQIKEFTFTGGGTEFDLDNDVHKSGTDQGQESVNKPSTPSDEFVAYVQMLYDWELNHGSAGPSLRVMEYIRSGSHNEFQWKRLLGGVDEAFIAYANEHGAYLMREFEDSFTGHELGADTRPGTPIARNCSRRPESVRPSVSPTSSRTRTGTCSPRRSVVARTSSTPSGSTTSATETWGDSAITSTGVSGGGDGRERGVHGPQRAHHGG